MITLSKPIKIKTATGEEKEITKVEIPKENFTARVLIQAEKEFLLAGEVYPMGMSLDNSRAYQGYIAAKVLGCRYEDLLDIPATDYIKITSVIKGFLDGLDWELLRGMILEK